MLPEVKSRLPLWTKDGVSDIPDVPPEPVHVPDGSFWPLIASIGIVTIAIGVIATTLLIVLGGAAVLLVAIYAWAFEPFEV